MPGNLVTRIGRLETAAGVTAKTYPKVIRLVTRDEDETAAYRMAEEMGLDISPDSIDVLVIRLVAPAPKREDERPAEVRTFGASILSATGNGEIHVG